MIDDAIHLAQHLYNVAIEFTVYMYQNDPYHVAVEAALALWVVYLMLGSSFRPSSKPTKLSRTEIDELVEEWTPEPLVPVLDDRQKAMEMGPVIDRVEPGGVHVTIEGKDGVLNLGSGNYLGLSGNRDCIQAALLTLKEYGCGSCGPRGFYGSVNPHVHLEEAFARWLGVEESILYSYGFSTIASAIPAFAKRGDVIVADKAVSFPVQTGLRLSRSKILWYEHNDMDDLERVLSEYVAAADERGGKLNRRFVVTEGVFANTGTICDLPRIVELKNKFRFRLVVEESHSLGVLGASGKGVTEHFGVDIDELLFLTASLSNSFAAVGGICAGSSVVVDHQRLSGSGYCFSASAPPMLSSAANTALDLVADSPAPFLDALADRVSVLHSSRLRSLPGTVALGSHRVPFLHLVLDVPDSATASDDGRNAQEDVWSAVAAAALDAGILIAATRFNYSEEYFTPQPALTISVSAAMDVDDLAAALATIADIVTNALTSLPPLLALNQPIPAIPASPEPPARAAPPAAPRARAVRNGSPAGCCCPMNLPPVLAPSKLVCRHPNLP
ncbi:uncharacterized protein AMSG_11779 [Thecamonas trahens ATCC 50062]|uniref:serine C-palmitoyltransferase n=1 Tax=Thecamonas trahens ATCC 50062 TaxID=461836 RepID=A0A0L0D558_THETB|nr:hypothetical protein AMSG_11779 [Thecamonas trahens ATCC 50062]KNC47201.1 hypothetical protein AMSG_11779 [Thecamonas trahens ATCC 50062]|eukprot:XP_013760012.1 hypothetical protein AMSG_11779 [Thecamonas trahens ATCC 50062]